MKVVILCGGLGTRLREETEFRPKPMVEIGGRPILWHIMKIYAHHGFRDFVLCLGYRGNMIKEYFLNYEAMNNDFTICLGQKSQIHYHGSHEEQDFRVTLADTGLESHDRRARQADREVYRRRHLPADLRRRRDRRRHRRAGRVPQEPRQAGHGDHRSARCRASASSTSTTTAGSVSFIGKAADPTAGSAPASSFSTAGCSITSAATTASSSGNRWSGWPPTAS